MVFQSKENMSVGNLFVLKLFISNIGQFRSVELLKLTQKYFSKFEKEITKILKKKQNTLIKKTVHKRKGFKMKLTLCSKSLQFVQKEIFVQKQNFVLK